jgi:PAS domain S-box-containing protein
LDYETLLGDLQRVRTRGTQFLQQAQATTALAQLLPEALGELHAALEDLGGIEADLVEARHTLEGDRERYQQLFEAVPAAYLVTDPGGIIQEANQRVEHLLGVAQHLLVGKPLVAFVTDDDHRRLHDRLGHPDRLNAGQTLTLNLQAHRSRPVRVTALTSVVRDQAGRPAARAWMLQQPPRPDASQHATAPPSPAAGLADRPAALPAPAVAPDAAPDWDDLAAALHEVVLAAVPLLRTDSAGLMLADATGTLSWVTATEDAERSFEQAQGDLGEGPSIDAFVSCEVVHTSDLWADARWPRLAPAARSNDIRGVLAAPVVRDGQPVGTCNALTIRPRRWAHADVGAIGAYATMLARLIASATDARHHAEMVTQLQRALTSRVVIDQAVGVLMERGGLDASAAFERLRRRARSSGRRVVDIAQEITSRGS